MPFKRKLSTAAFWLFFAAILQIAVLHLGYNEIKEQAEGIGDHVYDSIYNSTRTNEVLLQNFSTITASQPNDTRALHRFSSIIRERYPYVERFQVIKRVTPENYVATKQELKGMGIDRFIIRQGVGSLNEISVGPSVDLDEVNYPIVFLSPFNISSQYLIGLDLRQHPVMAATMNASIVSPLPIATPRYYNEKGDPVFSLYQAVFSSRNVSDTIPSHLVAIQIDYRGLLPPSFTLPDYTGVTIRDEQGNVLLRHGFIDDAAWLPPITREYSINRFGQALRVEVTRCWRLADINWVLLIFLFLLSAALYKASSAFHEQRKSAIVARSQRMAELDRSRAELEERVNMRTSQLNSQLAENRLLAHRILQIQEQEKRFLARELHDELGQSLTAIRTDARIIKNLCTEETSAIFNSADTIDTIALHIYNVTHDLMGYLRPTALDELGLTDAIQECAGQLKLTQHNIRMATEYEGPLNELSETYNITLYRLVQEALNNVVRHARATQVLVEVKRFSHNGDDIVCASITDNGLGISSTPEKDKGNIGGFGLVGMRERIGALGGELHFTRPLAGGTRVAARIVINPDVIAMDQEKSKLPLKLDPEL